MNLSKQLTTLAVLLGGLTTALTQTINVSGNITNDTAWTNLTATYTVNGNLAVASNATLTVANGVKILIEHGVSVTVYGAMSIDHAEWVKLDHYCSDSSIRVYGSFLATGTLFQEVNGACGNLAWMEAYNGASFTATGCTFNLSYITFDPGSTMSVSGSRFSGTLTFAPGSVINVSGSQLTGTLNCPAQYVPLLLGNSGFEVVVLTGGTLSTNVSLPVLSSGMTQYQLGANLTIAAGATLSFGAGTRFYIPRGEVLTVNGGLVFDNAEWVKLDHYCSDSSIRVYGSFLATGTLFQEVNGACGNLAWMEAYNGANFTAANCTFNLNRVTFNSGSTLTASLTDFRGASVTLASGVSGRLTYCQFGTTSIGNGSAVSIHENDFSAGTVAANGSASATIDLTRNWWGTNNAATIETKITHHPDNSSLPTVTYLPCLLDPPSEHLLYVVDQWPKYAIAWLPNFVEVTFNREVNLSTFTAADVSVFAGRDQYPVINIAHIGGATYLLAFAGLLPADDLTIMLGPNIADYAGNLMDQDLDGIPGEPGEDYYVSQLGVDLTPPQVTRHTPSGDIAGTLNQMVITFNEPMDTSSFVAADVLITGPTNQAIATTSIVPLSNTRFQINFSPQTAFGEYLAYVGPHITDLAGNQVDQNGDGAAGQTNDVYTALLNLVDVDLQVTNLLVNTNQLWAGDTVRVSWLGTNGTGAQLLGDWTDALYLSTNQTWDISDIRLAMVPHSNGLPVNGSYSNAVEVALPGVLPGNYYLIVKADLANQEREGVTREQNNSTFAGPFPLGVHALNGGIAGTQSANDRFDYYAVQLGARTNLQLTLDSLATTGANEIYIAFERIPTRQNYDYRLVPGTPDAQLTIPATYDGGTWYVMVYANQVSGTASYQLAGQAYEILLTGVSPGSQGNRAAGTLTLTGDGFNTGTAVEFIAPGVTNRPSSVTVVSPSQLSVQVDLPAWATNVYDVRVVSASGASARLNGAFTLHTGIGPRLYANLVVPTAVGFHQSATLYVEYSNYGDAPMPAPMFVVHGSQRAYLTTDSSLAGRGLWTATPPAGVTDTVTSWATGSGSTPGSLQPGDSGRIPVYYLGLQLPWDFSRPPIEFSLGAITSDTTNIIDWASMKEVVRPEWMSVQAWTAAWESFTGQVGDKWGDFVTTRSHIINHLASLGQSTATLTMDQILAFAVAQAAEAGPVSTLASSIDAYAPAPGIPLVFGRVFGQSIQSRYNLGALGQGWSHNWDFSVQTLTNGDAVVHGPAGLTRYFKKGATAGTFSPLPGDYGTLTSSGGAYKLTEKSGLVTQFRTDGLLDYTLDLNANRVTCGYTSGRLVSLTHTNGARLFIAYNAAGRISSATNTNGPGTADDRITTYGYDVTGKYLTSVTAPGSRTTAYSYQTSGSAPALNALLSVSYPDGRNSFFAYDAYGRLTETKGDGNANRINYSYLAFGVVSAQDAAGVATTIRQGATGQPNRLEIGSSVVNSQYDSSGQMTQLAGPEGQLSRFSYDGSGNVTGITDPNRGQTQLGYSSSFNRLTALTDARGNPTQYRYDVKGNLTNITYVDGSYEQFRYDTRGNVTNWINRRLQSVFFSYNAAGQVTKKDYSTTAYTDYTYTYDSLGRLTSAVYATATNAFFTNSFTYTSTNDWLVRIDYPYGKWFAFAYDNEGRRTKRIDQDGYVENYSYDTQGRLQRMTDGTNNLIVEYVFDSAGRMSRKTLGNGVYTTYEYNASGQLTNLVNWHPSGTNISRFAYTYDASGRRTSMTTLEGTTLYGYDANGQLSSVTYPNSRYVQYRYDALGNRTLVIDNAVSTNYTANSLNEYTGVGNAIYTFDTDGNLTSKIEAGITNSYTYNAANRLIGMAVGTNQWNYVYDSFGNRAKIILNGVETRCVSDLVGGPFVAGEYDEGGQLIARYDCGYGLLSRAEGAGQKAFYTFDALGSTAELTGINGAILNSYRYDAFGNCSGNESVANSFTFVGQFGVVNAANSMFIMGARAYDPSIGRFITADPRSVNGGDVNLYTYAANSPAVFVDPQGTFAWAVPLAAGTAGALINTAFYVVPELYQGHDINGKVVFLKATSGFVSGFGIGGGSLALTVIDVGVNVGCGMLEYMIENPKQHWLTDEGVRDLLVAGLKAGLLTIPSEVFELDNLFFNKTYWGAGSPTFLNTFLAMNKHGEAIWKTLFTEAILYAPWDIWDILQRILGGSEDPNDKLTTGYGTAGYICGDATLPYAIRVENKSTATAPAQLILVTDQLSPNLDLDTFELNEIALGHNVIVAPRGLSYYQTTLDLGDCLADIEVSLDYDTRTVTATMMAIDPLTGWLPEDVMTGILPPNDSTGRGEGYIAFTISPILDLTNGAVILNEGTIWFDYNDPINTPTVTNTLDTIPPSSQVATLPPTMTNRTFTVTWSGQDNTNGSGVARYDIYLSDSGGDYWLILRSTTNTAGTFTGAGGHTYAFVSVAHDNASNEESMPGVPDAQTFVIDNSPPGLAAIADRVGNVGALLVFTNTATDDDIPAQQLIFSLDMAPAGATVNPTNGIFRWTPNSGQGSTTNIITVRVTDNGTPALAATRTFTVVVMPYVEVSPVLGRVVMLAGESTNIPVQVISSLSLSELGFTLEYPANRLGNLTASNPAPGIINWVNLQTNSATAADVYLVTHTNQVILGTQQVAQVHFTAESNQPSAFVPLQIPGVTAVQADGIPFTSGVGASGQLVIIGEQPLLEAMLATNGQRQMVLYGRPARSYAIEANTNLLNVAGWQVALPSVTMTNVTELLEAPDQTQPKVFYRARQVAP
jgi:RHS repeat-associated protein